MVVQNLAQAMLPIGILLGMMFTIMMWWLCEDFIREQRKKKKAVISLLKNKEDAEFLKQFWGVDD